MYLFILNPTAGRGRSVQLFEQVKDVFNRNKAEYTVWETTYAGEATELAKKAVAEGYENVISVGGDGTVLEVATGLVGSECNMGIIPAGTGNDFVRSLGMTTDVEAAAKAILNGNIGKVDIAKTEDNHYFMNVAGCGFDTQVLYYTERYKKNFKGQVAYLLGIMSALFKYKFISAKIELDDRVIDQDIYLVAVANGKTYGGGMSVAPGADVKDGYFDVTIIDRVSIFTVLTILPRFIKGKHDGIKQIKSYRSKKVRIFSQQQVPLNMDGEIIGTTPMSFEVIPSALNMFMPVG